ncbi:hypothetical protein [Neobacillus sp. DY30]|uniref:hypothetical protein n=1 Tax=Neobacillus sp. DY30 TaxID=3047871 RepID=UPI0024C02324|nr:hypothetical protein [Neobacillus sp. DY30]WHY03314.1 hypothetical protein QNH29_14290 [Neobacillus sp. DY30]
MKKLSEDSIIDIELYKLESNIIWKKANSNELKQQLITDLSKLSYRAKFKRFIGHSVRFGSLAAVLFIGFIFISQKVSIESLTNAGNNKEIYQHELPKQNKDETIVYTAEEQNLIESYNVKLGGRTVISATVSRVGESMLDVKKPHISYNQEYPNELQTLVDAIQRAEKRVGVFDMISPNYLFILTFEDKVTSKYLLWVGNDGGSFMNENDTHTLYRLPKELIDDINTIVK